jgi:hypothetical protein
MINLEFRDELAGTREPSARFEGSNLEATQHAAT